MIRGLTRETRIHNDIDLFVELKDYHAYIHVIKQHGFKEVTTEYTTDVHTVWKDDNQRIIDLHCFEFTDDVMMLCETFEIAIPDEYKEK